ncbi:MAG: thioredoxin domain-containing protein [Archangium sp.]|nr:thioredoxin domain-containing protein [Archangium sp.]
MATLLATSGGLAALAIYQWLELLEVRAGRTPSCAINATINCATVWDSPFAHNIHQYVGLPVAGLGVLWGIVGFVLSFLFIQRVRATGDGETFSGAVKVWALLGLLSCVTFVTASVQAKAVCLTCLGTYALVVGFAIAALRFIGGPAIPAGKDLMPGAGWGLVLTVPVYLGLLYPGSKTPMSTTPAVPVLDSHNPKDFGAIVDGMPEREKLTAAWARAQWKKAPAQDVSMFPVHALKGSPTAPMKVVEFSDILCGHCAQFETLFHEIEALAPAGSVSFEPRYYPLDGECNPDIKGTANDGVRCYAARLQICTEPHPKFFSIRAELFQNQEKLDLGLMLSIAKRHGVDEAALNTCMKSPETASRISEDLAYARRYAIEGTPLVLLNGKAAPPSPIFLMAMALSGGNPDSPILLKLPPAPVE